MTNTKDTPVEASERAYPMRSGSGGGSAAAGGDGIEREIEVLEDCTVSFITERRQSRRGAWERTGSCPAATRPWPSACPTSARSRSGQVTLFGCARRAVGGSAR